ncbi:MAG: endonuclease/exonuclease/phosphatase family protein [Planctomycetales bacterium]
MWISLAYLVATVAAWILVRWAGDRWWPATLLTFGPRWMLLVPLVLLVPLAAWRFWRALIPQALAALLIVGPIMGLCLSWSALFQGPRDPGHPVLRIVTYNCGGGGADKVAALAAYVRLARPDILVLNEWPNRPLPPDLGTDWHVGPRYGSIVASKFPLRQATPLVSERLERWNRPAVLCRLGAPWGEFEVMGLHLETPREGLEGAISAPQEGVHPMEVTTTIRRVESELASGLAQEAGASVIVAGDFNMPVDSAIYRQFWSGWQNAYSTAGIGYGYTKYTKKWGVRIDHVLIPPGWKILKAAVGPNLGGDHHPVLVEVELP